LSVNQRYEITSTIKSKLVFGRWSFPAARGEMAAITTTNYDRTPTPLLVIGANRSGTQWLSNILCNHSDVMSVHFAEHCGIIETNSYPQIECKFNFGR
jgi:hypothetical protein